jgi:hypothetical protein
MCVFIVDCLWVQTHELFPSHPPDQDRLRPASPENSGPRIGSSAPFPLRPAKLRFTPEGQVLEVVRYQPGSHDPGRGPARGLRLPRYEARREWWTASASAARPRPATRFRMSLLIANVP